MSSLKKHIEQFEKTLLKEANNLQTNSERMFNGDRALEKYEQDSFGFKDIKEIHTEELEEKDRIIEKLKEELKSQWLTNKTAFNTKKMYEDKLKKMEVVDTKKLISTLVEVSKHKQGNRRLDWKSWLEIPESKYLFQINESLAKKIFEENNRLITIREQRKLGGSVVTQPNYSLKFTGDSDSGTEDYVTTNFDPDVYELWKGFTVSYWVRADEETGTSAAFGRRNGSSEQRFFFGIHNARTWIGVGRNVLQRSELKHEMEIGTGEWYHWVVTYEGDHGPAGVRSVYRNGDLIWPTGITDGKIQWNDHTGEGSGTGGHNLWFGTRNNNSNYSNGWACGLDEVAIYNEEKDASWVSSVYNGGTKYNHKNSGGTGLVGYWRFNEGSGTTVKDLSGEGNHGTLIAGTGNLPTWEKR